MRKAKGIAAIFAGLLLMFRAGAITVSADEGKGNNGDVKIHAVGTPTADNRNEPHVCDFYIDGFNFDNGQSGTYTIVGQGGNAGTSTRAGNWGPADSKGNWHTPTVARMTDGHYKLTVDTGKGDGKHKVFWVECTPAANGQANTPPAGNGNQQNNGNNNGNGERSSVPTNSKSKAGGSKSGTNSESKKGGTATGTKSASKASKGTTGGTKAGSVTGTHSVSKDGTTTPTTTPAPVVIPSGGITLPNPVTLPVTIPVVEGAITIPAGAVITLPAGTSITLPNGTVLTGRIPTGTTLPAGTVLPAGTTITGTGVLGFESAPNQAKGAVSPELESPAVAADQATANLGVETSPVAGVTSLPSTSTAADNGIWGALGIMLTGIGAFLLRKPQRRLN